METKLSQLMEKGFCVFDQALKKEVLGKIKGVSHQALGDCQVNTETKINLRGASY